MEAQRCKQKIDLENELAMNTAKVSENLNVINEYKVKCKHLSTELAAVVRSNEDEKLQWAKERQVIEKDKADLQSQLRVEKSDIKEAIDEIAAINEQNAILKGECDGLEEVVQNCIKARDEIAAEKEQSNTILADLEKYMEKLEKEKADLITANEENAKVIAGLQQEVADLENEYEELRQGNQIAEDNTIQQFLCGPLEKPSVPCRSQGSRTPPELGSISFNDCVS